MDHASTLAQRLLRLTDDLQRNHEDPQLVCVCLESLYTDAIEFDMHGALIPAEVMDKLRESVMKYSSISDESLDDIVCAICQEFPGCGVKMLQGHLVERGVVVQQHRVRDALRRTDPEGVLMRQRLGIRRRQYNVTFPLELWHINGNHKLIR